MTPTKLLIGQILIVLAIVVTGVWFATQFAASSLAYQSELGRPWFLAFGRPVYRPWALFRRLSCSRGQAGSARSKAKICMLFAPFPTAPKWTGMKGRMNHLGLR